jgi:hypothetical protein
VYHYAFQQVGRFPAPPPKDSGWSLQPNGLYTRAASDQNIEHDIRKTEREQWNIEKREADGALRAPVQVLSWRRLTQIEHERFEVDREYRNALEDDGVSIAHNMAKAGALHVELLRVKRTEKLAQLDVEWSKAAAQKRGNEADAVEAKRQELRDFPVALAPTIAACKTVEELKAIQLPE